MTKTPTPEIFDEFAVHPRELYVTISPDNGGQDLDLYLGSARAMADALYRMGEEDGESTRDERHDHGWAISEVARVVTLLIFNEDGSHNAVTMTWAEAGKLRGILERWRDSRDGAKPAADAAAPAAPQQPAPPAGASRDIADVRYAWTVTVYVGGGVRLDTRAYDGNEESIALSTDNAAQLANGLRAVANGDCRSVDHPTLHWRLFRSGDDVRLVRGLGPRHYTMTPTCAALIALAIAELQQQLPQDAALRIHGLRPGTYRVWRDDKEEADALRWAALRRHAQPAEVAMIMRRAINYTPNTTDEQAAIDAAADENMDGRFEWAILPVPAPDLEGVVCGGARIVVHGCDDQRRRELLEQVRDLLNGDC